MILQQFKIPTLINITNTTIELYIGMKIESRIRRK